MCVFMNASGMFISAFVVYMNLNTPNWRSIDDNVTTWGGIGLGSPFYICGTISMWAKNNI